MIAQNTGGLQGVINLEVKIVKMKKKEKENKEKLEKELEEIDEEIEKKQKETYSSSKYKLLKEKETNLWKETAEKNRELRKLRRTTYGKYIKDYRFYRYLDITRIKSSVKQGIKRGLGVKHINLIDNFDIVVIVEQLVKEDLEKTNEKEMISDISKIDKKIERIRENKKRLGSDMDTLTKKRRRIYDKLYKEKSYRDKIKEKKRKEVSKILKEQPKVINKIRGKVERGLLLDALED